MIMFQIVSGVLQEKIRIPFQQEQIEDVVAKRQMHLLLSNKALYSVTKAKSQLKKMFSFSEECSHSLLFSVKNRIFILRVQADFMLKIYTTVRSLEVTFLFQIQLKKFESLKFFESEKVVVFISEKRLFVLDLKKVLLKHKNGYTAFWTSSRIEKVVDFKAYDWGYKCSFLTQDGLLQSVGIFKI